MNRSEGEVFDFKWTIEVGTDTVLVTLSGRPFRNMGELVERIDSAVYLAAAREMLDSLKADNASVGPTETIDITTLD